MEGITHKIRFKNDDMEIEVVGTRDFAEQWFEKLNGLPKAAKKRAPAAPAPAPAVSAGTTAPAKSGAPSGRKPPREKIIFMNNILRAATSLENDGKEGLLITDIRSGLISMKVPLPESSRDLSVAISTTIKKGFLERTGESVGNQKIFRLSESGKKRVERLRN